MIEALKKFSALMAEAEMYRQTLRVKYGLTDFQIGNAILAYRKPRGPYHTLASAVMAARTRLTNREKRG